MTSKLIVNTIEADTGISSVSFASSISMDSTSKFHFSAAGIDIGADTNINRPAAGVIGFNVNGAEKLRIDTNGHLNTSGIATASNFKTGSSNLHSTGLTVGNNFIHTTGINVGTGATIHVPSSNVLTFGTNSNERLRIASDGKVGINENPGTAQFEVKSAQLGGTAGNTQEVVRLHSPDVTNTTSYRFTNYRVSNGTSHSSSELRFRRHVDVTDMGYFGLGDLYASIGYGTAEILRIKSDGIIEIGTSIGASSDANIRLRLGRAGDCFLGIRATGSTTAETGIKFGDSASEHDGKFTYLHNGQKFRFTLNGNDRIFIEQNGDLKGQSSNANIIGFMGAKTTAGTTNWNDATNARSGNGYTLLLGTASNGPGPSLYYHPFTFEYSQRDGNGNMTQLAIPYNSGAIYSRYRYSGSWSGWQSH